ncbi:hypothetical protein OE88DRAFT_1284064 [Heliocybe sulcata]|uniref:Uncharacterized protein n=1 Tax=Heliocybe sulcata TaxID=5364 RepID=A0A5C3NAC1_9AGAM|nr:hypothetical protein OE88DRAFT_1284064 [Heliocybe sulcata]
MFHRLHLHSVPIRLHLFFINPWTLRVQGNIPHSNLLEDFDHRSRIPLLLCLDCIIDIYPHLVLGTASSPDTLLYHASLRQTCNFQDHLPRAFVVIPPIASRRFTSVARAPIIGATEHASISITSSLSQLYRPWSTAELSRQQAVEIFWCGPYSEEKAEVIGAEAARLQPGGLEFAWMDGVCPLRNGRPTRAKHILYRSVLRRAHLAWHCRPGSRRANGCKGDCNWTRRQNWLCAGYTVFIVFEPNAWRTATVPAQHLLRFERERVLSAS